MKDNQDNIHAIPVFLAIVCISLTPVVSFAQYRTVHKPCQQDDYYSDKPDSAWTLDKCIRHALKHNIDIKRQDIAVQVKKEQLSKAKWSYVPSFAAGSTYSISSGRVLDETTYNFVENETVGSSSTSISGSTELFNGFRKYKELQKAKLDLKAGLANAEIIRSDLRANVTAAYLETLCAKESITEAMQIVAMLEIQADKVDRKKRAGKVTEADYLQILAMLYSARNDVISARSNYDIARLELCQLLEIENFNSFELSGPEYEQTLMPEYCNITDSLSFYNGLCDIINRQPEVKSAQLNVDISIKNLQIANSSYWPSISLSAGYGSSHSNARQKVLQNSDGTFRYEAYPFFRQYADNASSYLSISFNIPILSGMSVRKNVRTARLAVADAEYSLASVKKDVANKLIHSYMDARTAQEKYYMAKKQVRYSEEVARQITIKYESGAVDMITYSTAISELATARYNVLSAKYETIFKNRIFLLYYLQ